MATKKVTAKQFLAVIDKMERPMLEARKRHDREHDYSASRPMTGPGTRVYEARAQMAANSYREERTARQKFDALRELAPMVGAGFLTPAEALKQCGFHHTMMSAAKVIAAPDAARLQRERNREINEENDAREWSERMFGLGEFGLGRTREARSDSIDESMFHPKRRR